MNKSLSSHSAENRRVSTTSVQARSCTPAEENSLADEVAKIVDYIKTDIPNYDTSVMEEIERAENSDGDETPIETNGSDELIDQVIDFIVRSKKASASAIQRKFRIGFNRAGRIIDELEERGIVGPDNGSKPREVLMTPYERSEYKERHENY